MTKFKMIEVFEIIQAGDVMLLKFICTKCKGSVLSGIDNPHCFDCGLNYKDHIVKMPKRLNRKNFRVLAGTERKTRQNIGKRKIRQLLENQENTCAYCFRYLDSEYHLEHIIPVSFGGSSTLSNLAIACPRCNLKASDLVFKSIYAKSEYIRSEGDIIVL